MATPIPGATAAPSSISDPPSTISDPLSTIPDPLSTISALTLRRARAWGDDELVVMYSGNMGLGHRFGEILAAAGEGSRIADRGLRICNTSASASPIHDPLSPISDTLSPISDPRSTIHDPQSHAAAARLRFVFFGGGKRREEVACFVREHPECGVELFDYAPAADLTEHLQSADVHLASLDPAWTGTMVPSKVQGIFGAGRPVIFIGSAASSIGRWVLKSGGGWVVAADDVAGLRAALAEAADPAQREARGRAALAYAEAHFDPQTNISRVAAILTAGRQGATR